MTTRDMTRAQFEAALKRNNFSKPVLFWCQDGENPNSHYPIIYGRGRTYRRATIANLLACRARTEERKRLDAEKKVEAAAISEDEMKQAKAFLGALNGMVKTELTASRKRLAIKALNDGLKDL
jgi:hypothetical protein